jgi:hypothetical protein
VPRSPSLDAGVRQTSSTPRQTATSSYTATGTASAPKAVNPKKLEALEAEVFKSLDYSPTAGAKGSATAGISGAPPVPALSLGTPIR